MLSKAVRELNYRLSSRHVLLHIYIIYMMCACKKGVRPPNLEDRSMMASYIPISGVRFISRSDNACPIERDNNNGKIVGGGGATNTHAHTHDTHHTHARRTDSSTETAATEFSIKF